MHEDVRLLAAVETLTLEIELRALGRVTLPRWLGSTLHGALGHALHALGAEPYARLFEATAPPEGVPPHLSAMSVPAVIFAPPPPTDAPVALQRGDALCFGVVLPASHRADVERLLLALSVMAERGLGKGRAAFELHQVRDAHGPVWSERRIVREAQPDDRDSIGPAPDDVSKITVATRTPLRLLREKKPIVAPTFSDLVIAAARRRAAFHACFGEAPPDVRLADLAVRSASVATLSANWSRFREARYSSRQERRLEVHGIVGEASYVGDCGAYLPLLRAAARLGIGKGPAFGFGRLSLS